MWNTGYHTHTSTIELELTQNGKGLEQHTCDENLRLFSLEKRLVRALLEMYKIMHSVKKVDEREAFLLSI